MTDFSPDALLTEEDLTPLQKIAVLKTGEPYGSGPWPRMVVEAALEALYRDLSGFLVVLARKLAWSLEETADEVLTEPVRVRLRKLADMHDVLFFPYLKGLLIRATSREDLQALAKLFPY